MNSHWIDFSHVWNLPKKQKLRGGIIWEHFSPFSMICLPTNCINHFHAFLPNFDVLLINIEDACRWSGPRAFLLFTNKHKHGKKSFLEMWRGFKLMERCFAAYFWGWSSWCLHICKAMNAFVNILLSLGNFLLYYTFYYHHYVPHCPPKSSGFLLDRKKYVKKSNH